MATFRKSSANDPVLVPVGDCKQLPVLLSVFKNGLSPDLTSLRTSKIFAAACERGQTSENPIE